NGSGKSNLYRALRLLAETARGRLVPWLAREGGLRSTLWAGPEQIGGAVKRGEHPVQGTRRKEPGDLRLGFAGDDFGYAIDLGLPVRSPSAFSLDVVSHAAGLVGALEQERGCHRITLEKDFGETRVAEAAELERPSWQWPAR